MAIVLEKRLYSFISKSINTDINFSGPIAKLASPGLPEEET